MQYCLMDHYSRLESPIHRLPPLLKLAATFGLILTMVIIPLSALFLGVALFLASVTVISRISPLFLLKRLLVLEPFVLGVAALAFFQPDGARVFLMVVIRSTLCLFSMILLIGTTPFTELLIALRRLRIPPLLTTTLALMYRYLSLFMDESRRLRIAQASRTFSRSRRRTWQLLALVIGQLFVRSTERAERIYAVMCARGWK